jgi:hypothetical protein
MTDPASERLRFLGSLFQSPRVFQQSLLGSVDILERRFRIFGQPMSLETLGETPIEPLRDLMATLAQTTIGGIVSSIAAVENPLDAVMDIHLALPTPTIGRVMVALRDVGADKPRIFYDPNRD